jgi:TRAP-type C4-dicarboxylate transport system substrate-binding protein
VNLAVTKALGGIPIAIPYGEVYTAIQQKKRTILQQAS